MTAKRAVGWLVAIGLLAVIGVGMATGKPSDEARVKSLGNAIKCPVCAGVSISDSNSETAEAMMDVVEEKVVAGWTDDEIVAFFEDRYGESIRLDPPFAGSTLALWLLPVAAVGVGAWMILGRRRKAGETADPVGI